jgi:hypothetical protein
MVVENRRLETMIIGSRDFFPEGGSRTSKKRTIVMMALIMHLTIIPLLLY